MNTNRYWLTIIGFALTALALWLYNNPAHASSYTRANEDSTFEVTCTNTSVDLVVAECKAMFWQICPEGGTVIAANGSPLDAQPLNLTAVIKCNDSKVI